MNQKPLRQRRASRLAAGTAMASAPLMVAAMIGQAPSSAAQDDSLADLVGEALESRGGSGDPAQADEPAAGWTSGTKEGSAQTVAAGGSTYKVRPGDTLFGIARTTGISVKDLRELNQLAQSAIIHPGQILSLPPKAGEAAAASTHRVKAGDTLAGIALKYGTTATALRKANAMGTSSLIRVGELLNLSGAGATSDRQRVEDPDKLPHIADSFEGRKYPADTTRAAQLNKAQLMKANLPARDEMKTLIRSTATQLGVDPALALAVAQQESGFNPAVVSPANAIGVMQVIPSSGRWASGLVGRQLDLLDPADNVTAGVAILRQLGKSADTEAQAIGGYYQGLGSVRKNGLYTDTKRYVRNVQHLKARFQDRS